MVGWQNRESGAGNDSREEDNPTDPDNERKNHQIAKNGHGGFYYYAPESDFIFSVALNQHWMSTRRSDSTVHILGVVLALASGWLQIKVHDLLFTALLVVASAMVLGAIRPRSSWRWAILFPVLVPLTQLVARVVIVEKSTRAEVYESLLLFLPGIAGAYGGSVLRQTLQRVWSGK
jgi:hypothetical protein